MSFLWSSGKYERTRGDGRPYKLCTERAWWPLWLIFYVAALNLGHGAGYHDMCRFVVLLSSSRRIPELHLKLHHHRFLPDLFQFVTHRSLWHLTLADCIYTVVAIEAASRPNLCLAPNRQSESCYVVIPDRCFTSRRKSHKSNLQR